MGKARTRLLAVAEARVIELQAEVERGIVVAARWFTRVEEQRARITELEADLVEALKHWHEDRPEVEQLRVDIARKDAALEAWLELARAALSQTKEAQPHDHRAACDG